MGGNNDLEFEPAEGDGDLPRVERDLERLPLHEQTPVRTKEEAGVECSLGIETNTSSKLVVGDAVIGIANKEHVTGNMCQGVVHTTSLCEA